MGRAVRGSVPQIMRTAHQYLHWRDEEARARREKEKAGGKQGQTIKDYIASHGEPNGDHLDWLFDEPVTIGGETFLGMRRQASSDEYMDEELAQELVERKGLRDRVVREVTVEVWDYDELYVLNQEGLVTNAEIDSLMTTETKYSLVVIK